MIARLLLVWCLALFPGLAGAADSAFILGVLPIHSMRTLAERFEPLRAYLATHLGRPVFVESAVDFSEYYARTLRGEFDLAIIPAHFARLAQKDKGFQPLIQFQPDNDALLVYWADRPLDDLERMRNQQLAVIDRLAVTVMAVVHHLGEKGLQAGRDYRLVEYRNHASVAQALANGQTLAGVTTTHALQLIPAALRDKLKVAMRIPDIPSFVGLAKPDMPRMEAKRLQEMLLTFSREQAGQDFLRGIAFAGFVPAEEKRLKRVDAFLTQTRKGLAP